MGRASFAEAGRCDASSISVAPCHRIYPLVVVVPPRRWCCALIAAAADDAASFDQKDGKREIDLVLRCRLLLFAALEFRFLLAYIRCWRRPGLSNRFRLTSIVCSAGVSLTRSLTNYLLLYFILLDLCNPYRVYLFKAVLIF